MIRLVSTMRGGPIWAGRSSSSTSLGRSRSVVVSRCLATKSSGSGSSDDKKGPPAGIPYSKLTVGVPKEHYPLERRVAASPESVQRLIKPGFRVMIEDGAGSQSHFSNKDYEAAGATIATTADQVWKESDRVRQDIMKLGARKKARSG